MNNNIQEVILKQNMTQGDLAQKVGVKREYINRKINPTVPLGMRIARTLGVTVEDLFIINR